MLCRCLIPRLGRSPGEGKVYPLQYSGLENFMDSIVHGVAKSRTQLSDFHFYFLALSTWQVILKLCLWPQDDHCVTSTGDSIQSLSNVSLTIYLSQNAPTSQDSVHNASQAHACTSLPPRGERDHHGWLYCLPGAYGERR